MSTRSTDRPVKQPVWDLPTRLFHWLLVILLVRPYGLFGTPEIRKV